MTFVLIWFLPDAGCVACPHATTACVEHRAIRIGSIFDLGM